MFIQCGTCCQEHVSRHGFFNENLYHGEHGDITEVTVAEASVCRLPSTRDGLFRPRAQPDQALKSSGRAEVPLPLANTCRP